mgnify:FL=1
MALLVQIRKDSSRALFRQIVDETAEKIERGTLVPGDRLPPSRSLARSLEINRTTVCRAYQEL